MALSALDENGAFLMGVVLGDRALTLLRLKEMVLASVLHMRAQYG